MKKVLAWAILALPAALSLFSGGVSANHESWHKEGLTHRREGLLVTPLSIIEKRIVIPRKGCKARGDCDLKEIVFFEEDDDLPIDPRVPGDFPARSTFFMAGIETETVDALTNYVFVQFVRGCIWTSIKNPDGSMTTRFNVNRDHLGKRTHYVHRDWVVDSMDREPVYSAYGEGGDRHYFLQWSDPRPRWIPRGTQNLWKRGAHHENGEHTPTVPFGFVTDSPEPIATFHSANLDEQVLAGAPGKALNRSLQFKMCLYRTSDVPLITDGTTKGFGVPIACHEWRSSHVFDHDRGVFTSPSGIHGQCSRPFSDEEKSIEEFLNSQ